MRAALLDEDSYVINVMVVGSLDFMPNLVLAETAGNIGDYWDGENFIAPDDPAYPPHPTSSPKGQ